MYKHGSECLSPAQFLASWTLQAVTGAQEASNACARSPTVRAACGCCPDTDDAACLLRTSGRTALNRKAVAAAGTGAGDSDVQECQATVPAFRV